MKVCNANFETKKVATFQTPFWVNSYKGMFAKFQFCGHSFNVRVKQLAASRTK